MSPVTVMMDSSEVVSGYFGDIPCGSAMESAVFFDLLTSSRVHRIPEAMMSRADDEAYFTDGASRIFELLSDHRGKVNKGDGLEVSSPIRMIDVFPHLLCTTPASRITRAGCCGGAYVEFELKGSSTFASGGIAGATQKSSNVIFVNLDLGGMDHTWQSLINFLLGNNEEDIVIVVRDVDFYCAIEFPYGQFMFSIWVLVVSSVLHHFASFSNDFLQERLSRVKVVLRFSEHDTTGSTMDDVYLFVEGKYKITVCNYLGSNLKRDINTWDYPVELFVAATEQEWFEKVAEVVTNFHEELCDRLEGSTGVSPSCILLVVPRDDSLVGSLEERFRDSYTSLPMSIAKSLEDFNEPLDGGANAVPLTIFCSKREVQKEFLKPRHECCFTHMKVEYLIFAGPNAGKAVGVVQALLPFRPKTVCLPLPGYDNDGETCTHLSCANDHCLMEAMNVVLWLFRRFRFELDTKGVRPVLRIPQGGFLTRDASCFFERIMNAMCSSGMTTRICDPGESPSYQLSVVGRGLSYRFRLPYTHDTPELTPFDVKCIFWCHALRQPRAVAQKLIYNSHRFPSWVDSAIDKLCLSHRIVFSQGSVVRAEALVRMLTSFSGTDRNWSRVASFLRCSTGARTPLSKRTVGKDSSSCRGWFDQASCGARFQGPQQSPVTIYCYPSHTELCEICFNGNVLQCPLDASYPLIATHVALHTTLWNCAVFLECTENLGEVSLPTVPVALLQSPTFNRFTGDFEDSHTGLWLDNSIGSSPSPSDALQLGSLMGRTVSFLGLCDCSRYSKEREGIRSLKRQRIGATEVVKTPPDAEAETIREFVSLVKKLGRENAEQRFKTVKGFAFLNESHQNHPYYLHVLGTLS